MPIWHPLVHRKQAPDPLRVRQANGIMLELDDGRQLMNLVSSWWFNIHGHGHPKIAQAIYEQALSCEHVNFSDFTHQPAEKLTERVLALTPNNLRYALFADNGSTAVEIALKIAIQYWYNLGQSSRKSFLRFEGGYHGDTIGTMAVGREPDFHRPFLDHFFPVATLPFPDTYWEDETIEEKEQQAIQKLEAAIKEKPDAYAAIVIEPLLQGCAGMRICRPEFLQQLQAVAHHHNILVIYDEVMTGFGRTGEWFACTKADTQPDILCLSKGLSGGYLPISLTLCSDTIYEAFNTGNPNHSLWHSHTFGGSAIACAASLASLDLLKDEPFRDLEAWHRPHLEALAKLPQVTRPRLLGTLAAFDLVTHHPSGYHNPIGKTIKRKLMQRGLYVRPLGNTLYLLPPYCITKEQLDTAYNTIQAVIA